MNLVQLSRSTLVRDERCQARAEFDEGHAQRIAAYLYAGGRVPPVKVCRGADGNILWDGFHRDRALSILVEEYGLKRPYIEADVQPGTLRDAILFAVGANRENTALTLTDEDKYKAAMILLTDDEWSQWSAVRIAAQVGCGHDLVSRLRRQLKSEDEADGASYAERRIEREGVKVTRGGTTYTMRFREMTPAQQRTANAESGDAHRKEWLREARQGLQQAERALQCLRAADALASVRAALADLPTK